MQDEASERRVKLLKHKSLNCLHNFMGIMRSGSLQCALAELGNKKK